MTDQNAIRDDIAFLRNLAEEGRIGSTSGGSVLVAAGVIYATCSVASWAAIAYGLNWDGYFPIVWFGGTGLFFVAMNLIKRRLPTSGGAVRNAAVTWWASSWAILTLVISLMIMSARTNAWWLMAALPSMILAVYGACWFVGAVLTRKRWLHAVAFGAFAMALVNAWFVTSPATAYLVYAAALLGLLSLPGFVLMRQAGPAA
jgi:hypothetical protein